MENIWIFMGMQWDFMYFYGKFNFFSLKIADFLIQTTTLFLIYHNINPRRDSELRELG